jgi:hypothetical protein
MTTTQQAPRTQTNRLTARAVHDNFDPRIEAIEAALSRGAQPNSLFANVMTVSLGVFIPAISLTMSSQAANMFQAGNVVLGGAFAALVFVVLAVSLTHLAEAVEDLTGSTRFISWATAIAFDACLVAFEVAHKTVAKDDWTVTLMIAVVAIISAALNVHAFRLGQAHRVAGVGQAD